MEGFYAEFVVASSEDEFEWYLFLEKGGKNIESTDN